MTRLSTLFDHYINSSLHVGLNVTALVFISGLQFNMVVTAWVYIVAFTATVVGYNTIKYGQMVTGSFSIRLERYSWLSYLAATIGLFAAVKINWQQQLILFVVGLMVLFYAFPIHSNKRNIRNQRKIKIYWVACVWSVFTVLFPSPTSLSETQFWVVISHRFLFVLCATLPFEIRDFPIDPKRLRTWPQRFGVSTTRWLGIFLAIGAGLFGIMAERQLALLVTHVFLVALLFGSKTNQSKYYAAFWVESLPLLWALLAVLN